MAKEDDTGLVYNLAGQDESGERAGVPLPAQRHSHSAARPDPRGALQGAGRDIGEADDTTDAFALAEATIGLMEGD